MPTLTAANRVAGFALVSASAAESGWDIPPEWAETRTPWAVYGAHRDFFGIRLGAETNGPPAAGSSLVRAAFPPFPVGTNFHGRVFVSPCGTLSFGTPAAGLWPDGQPAPDGTDAPLFAPLGGPASVVPPGGSVWHGVSPSNTLVVTWRGISLDRDPAHAASAQCELWPSGDFAFRVRVPANAPDALFAEPGPPFRTAALNGGGGEALAWDAAALALARSGGGAELRWRGFGFLISPDGDALTDTDGDGLADDAEVLVHGTSPHHADTDGDGLPDAAEIAAGLDPLDPDTDRDLAADGIDPEPTVWNDPDARLSPYDGYTHLHKVLNRLPLDQPVWYRPPGAFSLIITLESPVPAPGAVLRVGDIPLVLREPGQWELWLDAGRPHALTLCRQGPAPAGYTAESLPGQPAIVQTGWADGGGPEPEEPPPPGPVTQLADGMAGLAILLISPPEYCVHRDGAETFTATGPAAAMHGTFTWTYGEETFAGRSARIPVRREDRHLDALHLSAALHGYGTITATASIGHCNPPKQDKGHSYWCGNCMRWMACTEITNLCAATDGSRHMGPDTGGGLMAAWAVGENCTNHTAGMSGPGVPFPDGHSGFSAQPRLESGSRGVSSPDLPALLESIWGGFPGCPEPLSHFRECCQCPAHFPLFIVLPGWGPVKLASGSAALELRTLGPDGSGEALSAGGTVPDGHMVTAIGLTPSAYPEDTTIRFTQDAGDGQEAEETHWFTVMDVKLWPDTDGDRDITDAEKEAWAETNRADAVRWQLPSGGKTAAFELDNRIGLEGYWTVALDRPGGGGASSDAYVLFGDWHYPVVTTCGSANIFTAEEIGGSATIQISEPGLYTLTAAFTGTGSADGYSMAARLEIEAHSKVEFLSAAGHPTTNALQVGLWENAFIVQSNSVTFRYPDFVNHDPRRFRVRVTDPENEAESVTVSLSALPSSGGGHGQAARTLTLPRVSPGVFASTNLLLVSDAADAAVSPSETVPGINDRLFECELGGTVRALFTDSANVDWRNSAEIGRDVKSVTVDAFVMTIGGVPAVPGSIVERDLADMAERYAQADVRINIGQITQVEMPFAYTNWYARDEFYNGFHLSTDSKRILDALPRTSGHIGVIYVPGPLYRTHSDANPTPGIIINILAGMAIAGHGFKYDAAYLGNVFISSTESTAPFIPAHEVGHILAIDTHSDDRYNLMWESKATHKGIKQPKRLDASQIEIIRRSPYTR